MLPRRVYLMRKTLPRFVAWPLVQVVLLSSFAAAFCGPAFSQGSTNDEIARLEQQAEADLHAQKSGLAIASYKKILSLDPGNVGAHSNLGLAYYIRGDYAAAVLEFRTALDNNPDQWNILGLCGIAEGNTGRNAEAIVHLGRAFAHVQDPTLRLAAGQRLFALFFEKGDLPHAAETVAELRQLAPQNADVIYAAHQVYSLLENQMLLAMAQLAPDSPRLYQLHGDRYAQAGNWKAAMAAYREAIDRDSHLSGIHFQLAEILSISADPVQRAEAEPEYRKALDDNPRDEKSECRLGDLDAQRSDIPSALQHYQRALSLQPDDPDANEGYAMALLASNSPADSRKYLERAVQLDPDNAAVHYHLSQAHRRAGDLEQASREMNKFLVLKARNETLKKSLNLHPPSIQQDTSNEHR